MFQSYALPTEREETTSTMKVLAFYGPGQIGLETAPIPRPGAGEAVIRVILTSSKLPRRNSHCLKLSGKAKSFTRGDSHNGGPTVGTGPRFY
jgi:hypothetical protein